MKDHLNYYKKINRVVTVDIKDTNKKLFNEHCFNYYFQNKIIPVDLKDKSVIEFCAGSGYNAYYLLTKSFIKDIHLIEKNPSSLKNLIKLFNKNTAKLSFDKKINHKILSSILKQIKIISSKLNKLKRKNEITLALNEFPLIIDQFKKKKNIPKNTKYFYKFFGRYNQSITLSG